MRDITVIILGDIAEGKSTLCKVIEAKLKEAGVGVTISGEDNWTSAQKRHYDKAPVPAKLNEFGPVHVTLHSVTTHVARDHQRSPLRHG